MTRTPWPRCAPGAALPSLLGALIILLTLTGCATDSGLRGGRTADVAILFVGFYNSEGPRFSPQLINYDTLVDRNRVRKQMYRALSRARYRGMADETMKWRFMAVPGAVDTLFEVKDIALGELQRYLFTPASPMVPYTACTACVGLALPDLAASPKFAAWSWDHSDRVVVFVGLESSVPGDAHTLRSALAALAFDGHGRFVKMAAVRYNFTRYSTAQMAADSRALLQELGMLPTR